MRILFVFLLVFSLGFADDISDFDDEFETAKKQDSFEGYNRAMTKFNNFVFDYALSPITSGYNYIVPETPRVGIANFFENLLFPVRLVNNLLQFKFKNSFDEMLRFLANTIFGVAGLGDVATNVYNIPKHNEDFGQTLGYYGVGSGAHFVLPFLGPSNLRDIVGLGGDYFAHPVSYVKPPLASFGIKTYEKINFVSLHKEEYESLRKDAFDLYILLRDAYEQRRNQLIKE